MEEFQAYQSAKDLLKNYPSPKGIFFGGADIYFWDDENGYYIFEIEKGRMFMSGFQRYHSGEKRFMLD